MTILTFIIAFAFFVAIGCFLGSSIVTSKGKVGPAKEGEIELTGDLKIHADKLVNFVMKDYSPAKVVSKSSKNITIISKDDFNDVGRVFRFSMNSKTKNLDISCTKYPGEKWMEKPIEYNFHMPYNEKDHSLDYGKEQKKIISQIKQKMLFHPVLSHYKPMEDF